MTAITGGLDSLRRMLPGILLGLFALPGGLAAATLEDEVARHLAGGREADAPLWLEAGGVRFLALPAASRDNPAKGGVLLIHDAGSHADAAQVIGPLRRHLHGYGWTTLSLQMPRLPDGRGPQRGRWLEEAVARIGAGMAELVRRGAEPVFLLGHGRGAVAVLAYAGRGPQPAPAGLVLVSPLELGADNTENALTALLARLTVPALDVYGSRGARETVRNAPARVEAARRSGKTAYRQWPVEGADHGFGRMQEILSKRVRGWLEKQVQDMGPAP